MRELLIGKAAAVGCAALLATCANAETISLDGSWDFRFDEGMRYCEAGADFVATDRMAVPGCYDMMPKWLCKRGTGRYRRTFTLEKPLENAWLVIDGMGLTGHFRMDGRDLGVHPYPYARIEIPTGPLAAGEHVLFAALDNRFDWEYQKLARPYYDFYCFGGFYHGVSLKTDNRKLFVRTRDYATGEIEVEVEGKEVPDSGFRVSGAEGERTLVFDGTNAVKATFRNGRAKVKVPNFRLWSPESPNLHTVELLDSGASLTSGRETASPLRARFGIRTVEARNRKIWLNGKEIYLKGFNRHESHPTFGAATDRKLMALDLQNLKSLGANFVRGCHYQQAQEFLDLCDEQGVLVWEESLGWGNGSHHEIAACELTNETFRAQQVHEMREMVRASINHPCVILTGFMNEFASQTEAGKSLAAELVKTIRQEDSGHLTTFACSHTWDDISHAVTDVVAFNSYPGWFDSNGVGSDANFRRLVRKDIDASYGRFRKLYPEKPIVVSEMGVCAIYGAHDPAAAQWTEEFQAGALAAIIDEVFSYDDICGLALWHFADARSYHRSGSAIRGKPFAENLAGVYDGFRRAKLSAETVRARFSRRPGTVERPADATFRDGDRVVFLGDSLTQGGRYHRIISDYYLTRFPDRDVRFFDAGVGGDSVKYCWPRFVGDVVRPKPTVVSVMFGSNDAGFRTPAEFTADMTNLAKRIAKECGNPRTVWITSTPYDEYSVRDSPKARPGYDAKMRALEESVRIAADFAKGGYCEFGDPLREYMARKRKADPAFSLMPDRDHPKEPGHLIMAWQFLRAQGAPSLVSALEVDAAALTAKAENATVGKVRREGGAVAFEVTEKALPMPFHAEAKFVLDDLPVARDLSRETLKVSGLGWGWWALVIDGQQVVEASAEDWAKGVDLATLDTPQMRQARRVMDLNGERFLASSRYRRFVAMRWWTQWSSPKIVKHPDDEENYADLRALWNECERSGDTNNYYNCVMPQYWDYWPKRAAELKRIDALYDAARAAAQPVRRTWRLESR